MSILPERTLGRSDSAGQMRSLGAPSNCVGEKNMSVKKDARIHEKTHTEHADTHGSFSKKGFMCRIIYTSKY